MCIQPCLDETDCAKRRLGNGARETGNERIIEREREKDEERYKAFWISVQCVWMVIVGLNTGLYY